MASFYRVYPLKRPSIGLSKAYDAAAIARMPAKSALKAEAANLAIVTIRLPPSIGLGLDRAAQFRALGFRDATFHVAVPKLSKRAVIGSSYMGGMSVFTSSTAVSIKDKGLLDIDFLYTADEEDEFDQYLKYTIAAHIFELKNQLVGHIAALIWRAYKSKAESGSDLSAVGSDNLTNESETTTESVVEKSTKKLQKRFELLKKLSMSQQILATKITCLQVRHQSLANLRPKTSMRTKTMTTTATAVKLVTSKNESLSLFSKS